jgi:hypothetical protein
MRYLTAILLLFSFYSRSQNDKEIAEATELSIPTSGAFNLMNVNPTTVGRPGFMKDFTLNSFIKDGKLLDDIALDAQPFWILFFKHKNLTQYQKLPLIARLFGNLNFSLGTTKKKDYRQLAYSGKITLRKDPLMDQAYINELEDMTAKLGQNELKLALRMEIDRLTDLAKDPAYAPKKDSLNALIKAKKLAFGTLDETIAPAVIKAKKKLAEKYIEDHWTDWVCDIGGGNVYNYYTPTLDSVQFNTNGFGAWINPAKGFKMSNNENAGKLMLTALFRWIQLDGKDNSYAGMNLRYGKANINGFVEYIYENKNKAESHVIAYGATYKIDNKKAIEFGLRHQLDKNFQLNYLIPTISINWALAKDILK